jgi:hypothetical protein
MSGRQNQKLNLGRVDRTDLQHAAALRLEGVQDGGKPFAVVEGIKLAGPVVVRLELDKHTGTLGFQHGPIGTETQHTALKTPPREQGGGQVVREQEES